MTFAVHNDFLVVNFPNFGKFRKFLMSYIRSKMIRHFFDRSCDNTELKLPLWLLWVNLAWHTWENRFLIGWSLLKNRKGIYSLVSFDEVLFSFCIRLWIAALAVAEFVNFGDPFEFYFVNLLRRLALRSVDHPMKYNSNEAQPIETLPIRE